MHNEFIGTMIVYRPIPRYTHCITEFVGWFTTAFFSFFWKLFFNQNITYFEAHISFNIWVIFWEVKIDLLIYLKILAYFHTKENSKLCRMALILNQEYTDDLLLSLLPYFHLHYHRKMINLRWWHNTGLGRPLSLERPLNISANTAGGKRYVRQKSGP